ncbi:tRNA preQ1(34) S-adenosylmethionine ribosyltransferase-isomerase QueA [Desulfopila aestuarii]|uniref:S-adenosylmethionine:tRNA ribosyltransferase-isomerase n=1 Tax=Desulfopila aestuarii DSM 18488 TaxID=1121416 RepID=A0A1M7XZF1_9BACT|nr:tRNA preQ1(34) S-adenosylmethionine ribosyltransferase-isomerase QueA [Desulfopila aestuarii]SHO44566.1 S-adenosylmethionine--tRNA ribosyltransferase-isomerase [Desulfopila aestuarii DSM 18488]
MEKDFTLEAYNYHLPVENIAQKPADRRDKSRLLVLDTADCSRNHRTFADILDYIGDDDMLVVNDTRVFPARLYGKKDSGGRAEVFLLGYPMPVDAPGSAEVEALIKSSKRPKPGSTITISPDLTCTVLELLDGGKARLALNFTGDLDSILAACGQVPLPPYISRNDGTTPEDVTRYQTVYANQPGAVAAPTAGLHFTEELLAQLTSRGVLLGTITLHVGYGTFAPVRAEKILEHRIHEEYVVVPKETVEKIEAAKKRGGRIWAVGTTTVRALEFAARDGQLRPIEDWCDLYIYPGFTFRVIDNLITNFHLPGSSLMFLVSALCGRETLLDCYQEAIREGYRFYSYGDAMAVIRHRP